MESPLEMWQEIWDLLIWSGNVFRNFWISTFKHLTLPGLDGESLAYSKWANNIGGTTAIGV